MNVIFGVKAGQYKNGKSAEQVANYIEHHYGLIATYIEMYQKKIAAEVTKILVDNEGELPGPVVMEAATRRFKRALTEKRFDGKIAGVPTKASLTGKSRVRLGRPRKEAGKHGSGHIMVYKRKTRPGAVPVFSKQTGFKGSIPVSRKIGYDFVGALKAVRARPSFVDTGLYRRSIEIILSP
jgi:hypothetical protein